MLKLRRNFNIIFIKLVELGLRFGIVEVYADRSTAESAWNTSITEQPFHFSARRNQSRWCTSYKFRALQTEIMSILILWSFHIILSNNSSISWGFFL